MRHIPKRFGFLLAFPLLLWTQEFNAQASSKKDEVQKESKAPKKKKRRKSPQKTKELRFDEGDELVGDLISPDGEGLHARGHAAFSSLIRVRYSFVREIHKSAEDL